MENAGTPQRPRIIHLDDDELVLGVSRSILIAGGFDVTTTRDPAELLDLHERTFDLVILDLLLPQMDGFSVCQSLRREGWSGPMLVATARVLAGHERRILEEMRADYLLKPFGPHQLLGRVRLCLTEAERLGT
jgi:DNA-binding response OmpR family regulator